MAACIADESLGSIAFIHVSVHVCVCPDDRNSLL